MAVADEQVAGATRHMDGGPKFPQQHARERRLHHAFNPHAIGFGVLADNFDIAHRRHPFAGPFFGTEPRRIGRRGVRAQQRQGGPRPGHEDPRRTARSPQRKATRLLQPDYQRLREAIVTRRQFERAIAIAQAMLERGEIIHRPITHRAKVSNVAHAISRWNEGF